MPPNLIPDRKNTSPDYYCTWQTQLYATSEGKPAAQRDIMTENSLFSEKKPFGWAYFYPRARSDLMIVMDDSWDVPVGNHPEYYGSLILNSEKFPTFASENNTLALKKLSDTIKSLGWRGVGGWVCCQESPLFSENISVEEYWTKRLDAARESGFCYWKVDWGAKYANEDFRKFLSENSRKYAPELTVENAMRPDVIPYSDAFRTYDVPEIMSIPMTIEKLISTLSYTADSSARGIINCEDEVYIAAALGCSMGVMRHPYAGLLPNGKPDPSFPACHRDVKRRIDEVARAAIWHRIAPAFAVNESETHFSSEKLTDTWQFSDYSSEIEEWWLHNKLVATDLIDGVLTKQAVSEVSRGVALPQCEPDNNGNVPYIVASKNPSGVVSIATLGRTNGRIFDTPRCNITLDSCSSDTIGVFGYYNNLTLANCKNVKNVLAQDLLANESEDITEKVKFENGKITIPGIFIKEIGTSGNADGDISDPGLVLKLI